MNALVKLEKAAQMLAEVRDARGAKKIKDVADAAEHYARKARLGKDSVLYAHGIKVDAWTLLGDLWKGAAKQCGETGGRPRKDGKPSSKKELGLLPPSLEDLGLTKKEAHYGLLLADIKREHPEEHDAIRRDEKTVSEVQRELKRQEVVKRVATLPTDKFRVLYADPPWNYGNTMEKGDLLDNYGSAEKHYPTMTIKELCAMPIPEIVEDNAVLFLWVTSPLLDECWSVIASWGFEYKTSFVWDKVKHNMGHYNSVRHEFLLVCTRGSCTPDVRKLHPSVQRIERSKQHTEKPEKFREIIDEIYPHGKRIELFARKKTKGWEVYGNEC